MADSSAWTLFGIEPPDNTFRDSGEDVHRAYWRWIAAVGVDRFHWRCNQGLGSNGEPLTPIAHSTWLKGRKRSYTGLGNANNPPLVPALGLSRFESLLKGRGFIDHAEWYWTVDPVTGLHWGQVAIWQAEGGGGRYPESNVIGWSPADVAWLQDSGHTWWYAFRNGHKLAEAMATLEVARDKFPRHAAAALSRARSRSARANVSTSRTPCSVSVGMQRCRGGRSRRGRPRDSGSPRGDGAARRAAAKRSPRSPHQQFRFDQGPHPGPLRSGRRRSLSRRPRRRERPPRPSPRRRNG